MNKLIDKKLYFYATHGGGGAEQCFSKLEKLLEGNSIVGKMDFVEPIKKQGNELEKKINDFCALIKK